MNARRWVVAALAILALAGEIESSVAEDQSRFCDATAANIVLMLDVTTPYDEIDKKTLIDGVARIFDELRGGERISIRTIEDEFSRGRRLFEACMPFCPTSGFFGDLFSSCTEGVVINERRRFSRAVVDKLASLLDSARELDHSEIIRTLTQSLREEYRKDRDNRIFVYSDMIENSRYLGGRDFFAARDGAVVEKLEKDGLIPNIWQADVRVFGIGRGGDPSNRTVLDQERLKKLTTFWSKYFAAGGATVQMHQNLTLDD